MAKFSFGNILGTASNYIEDNVTRATSTVLGGLGSIGNKLASEAMASITGQSPDSTYDSPFPLGNEWNNDPAYTVTIQYTDPNTKAISHVAGYMPDTISMGLTADYNSPLESVAEDMSSGTVGLVARMFGYKVSANMFSMVLWSGSSHMDLELELRFVALRDTKVEVIDKIRALYGLITPNIESFSVTQSPIQLGIVTSPGPSLEYAGDPTDVEAMFGTIGESVGTIVTGTTGAIGDAVSGVVGGETSITKGVIAGAMGTAESVGAGFNTLVKNLRVKNNISVKIGEFAWLKSVVIKGVTPAYNVKCDLDGNMIDATVSVSIGTFVSPTNIDIPSLVGYKSGGDGTFQGSSTSVNPLEGLFTPPFFSTGNIGLNLGDLNTPAKLFPSLGATITNPIGAVKKALLGNPENIGRDAGLGSKYMNSTVNLNFMPNAPGLSNSDRSDFFNQFST